MKKVLIVVAVTGLLAGCTTFENVLSSVSGGMDGTSETMAEGITLAPALEFTLLYATYYALGGYGFGEDNFPVGTGVTWQINSSENSDEATMTRAKLSPGGAGAFWWSFEVISGEDGSYYEFLVDKDDTILKVRYRDPQTSEVKEFVPDSYDSEEEDESLPADYSDYIVGKERITTPAGTFNADKMIFEDPDSSYIATYWMAKSAPGNSVRYIIENPEEQETITGELIAVNKGFETKLNSY